jgi:hypothetical protein
MLTEQLGEPSAAQYTSRVTTTATASGTVARWAPPAASTAEATIVP